MDHSSFNFSFGHVIHNAGVDEDPIRIQRMPDREMPRVGVAAVVVAFGADSMPSVDIIALGAIALL